MSNDPQGTLPEEGAAHRVRVGMRASLSSMVAEFDAWHWQQVEGV